MSIYKRCKLTQRGPGLRRKWILCTFEVRKKPSGTPFSVSTGLVENQIQALSRTMSVFKDFSISGLENLEKNSRTFKDPQEPWAKLSVQFELIFALCV